MNPGPCLASSFQRLLTADGGLDARSGGDQLAGFSFANLAESTPVTWSATEFYRLDISYSGGIITAQVFDSGGTALADAIMADTGYSGGGSLLLRGFGNGHVDDINIVPAPAALALLGLGGLTAARRRR